MAFEGLGGIEPWLAAEKRCFAEAIGRGIPVLGSAASPWSNNSSSTPVAYLEYTLKFTPVAVRVAPRGEAWPTVSPVALSRVGVLAGAISWELLFPC
jgi:hypothetical protein